MDTTIDAAEQLSRLLKLPRHQLESRLVVAIMRDAKPEEQLTAVVAYRTTAGRWAHDAAESWKDSKAVRSKTRGNRIKFGATATTVDDSWEFKLHEVCTAVRAIAEATGTAEWPYALAWAQQPSDTKDAILHGIADK